MRRISSICVRLAPVPVPLSVPVTPAVGPAEVSGGSGIDTGTDLGPAQADTHHGTILTDRLPRLTVQSMGAGCSPPGAVSP
jgi:hypothetical protein